MADRPHDAGDVDFAARNGWDRAYEAFDDFDLPTYVGLPTFMKLPWVTDPAELRAPQGGRRDRRRPVRRRRQPPARRPVRAAGDPRGAVHDGLDPLAPAGQRAVRDPDRRRRRRREHRPVVDRPRPRVHLPQGPRGRGDRRDPDRPRRRPLDHLAVRDRRRRGAPARAASASSTSTRTPTPRTTTGACSPATGRRCGGSSSRARSRARTSSRSGLRGYWPPVETFAWMQEQGLRWHLMREIEERGAEAVIDDAIAEALDGPDAVYISVDIDVIDPGNRAGHRHARARRDAAARGAARRPADREPGRGRGHGHRRGLAALRPRRGHGDGRATASRWRSSRRSRRSARPGTRSASSAEAPARLDAARARTPPVASAIMRG